jgi:hypothetical protein
MIFYFNKPDIVQVQQDMKDQYEKEKRAYVDSVRTRYHNLGADSAISYIMRPN